jgi:hypothetical protein
VSDSLAWVPTPLAPPIPTIEDILAVAAENLMEATKSLANSKTDITGWGQLLASRIRKLDTYIQLYHS